MCFKTKKFHQFLLLSAVFYKQACTHIDINRCSHRIQPPQSMFPVVSLMVRSETKAGYSVSHGTIIVLWALWAAHMNTKFSCYMLKMHCTTKIVCNYLYKLNIYVIFVCIMVMIAKMIVQFSFAMCDSCVIAFRV